MSSTIIKNDSKISITAELLFRRMSLRWTFEDELEKFFKYDFPTSSMERYIFHCVVWDREETLPFFFEKYIQYVYRYFDRHYTKVFDCYTDSKKNIVSEQKTF